MLILSRKPGETVVIDGQIRVKIVRVEGDVVKIGIEAPDEVSIHRQEVYDEIQRSNKESVTGGRPALPRIAKKEAKNKDKRSEPAILNR